MLQLLRIKTSYVYGQMKQLNLIAVSWEETFASKLYFENLDKMVLKG